MMKSKNKSKVKGKKSNKNGYISLETIVVAGLLLVFAVTLMSIYGSQLQFSQFEINDTISELTKSLP